MRALPVIKWFLLGLAVFCVAGVIILGPRGATKVDPPIEIFPDMDRQPKFKPQAPSAFFPDGRADRAPVPGTIPYGIPIDDPYFYTGKMRDRWGDGFPVKVDAALLDRGRERYSITCQVCHGALADGKGIAFQYGFTVIANLHQPRILEMADGEIFNTIGNGKNQMLGYTHLKPEDRWAIIAWLRVLQRAHNATLADAPPGEREKLQAAPVSTNAPPAAAPAPGSTNAPPAKSSASFDPSPTLLPSAIGHRPLQPQAARPEAA
jgi:mono/diheme cytochrome c family protein